MNGQSTGIKRRTNHFIEVLAEKDEVAVISNEFRNTVLTHIIGNYSNNMDVPLFLAIHGKPGEGKTFQTFHICLAHNLKICYFSGAELSGNYERDSILDFEENYKRACNYLDSNEYSVIIVDDFHLSPASTREGVGTTINSQLLTGFLMNLCDKTKNGQCQRIPIILLGNTFANVYEPLKRDGRMDFFYWESTIEIKKKVVIELLSPYVSRFDRNKLNALVEEYKDMPVSFFTEIKNDIDKKKAWSIINQNEDLNIEKFINIFNNSKLTSLTILQLFELAATRKESLKLSNIGGEWIL